MKSSVALLFLIAFVFVTVLATHCPHGDVSHCTTISCNSNQTLACEHDTCTCNPKPQACIQKEDCTMASCDKRDEEMHCIDGGCDCMKHHP